MRKYMMIILAALVMTGMSVKAVDVGIFGSHWDPKDDDGIWGGGILLLPASLPLELRGTYYESTKKYDVDVIPVDFGLNFQLTRNNSARFSVMGGGTYYFLEKPGNQSDNEFGWYAGGRVELSGPRGNALFGEALYRGADYDDSNFDFSGWTFNVGLMF